MWVAAAKTVAPTCQMWQGRGKEQGEAVAHRGRGCSALKKAASELLWTTCPQGAIEEGVCMSELTFVPG